ncbi:MAG TPA: M12 family metallopeptidase [Candidatus Limnocylindria bacterium]|nr:M12 family metallopeptidase [Candidatus Limnocylindria bacterium]
MELPVWKRLRSPLLMGILALGCGLTGCATRPPAATSDPAHMDAKTEKPLPWPKGIIPYDVSKLSDDQAATARQAMQLWMMTGANIRFIPRTTEVEYVYFTGRTDAGNNTTFNGYRPGARQDINITAFWWKQGPWMPAHELGHALGFFHEHQRWDRDRYVTIHYEHVKEGREPDYDWLPQSSWIVVTPNYDYRSIMHYRTCWASKCESECKDGIGTSPCAVIDPVGDEFDGVIGQWGTNKISEGDAEKLRLVYGVKGAK